MANKNNTLILGIGNDILTDDGIGPKLVRKLNETIHAGGVDFLTASTGGMEVIEMIRDYEHLIIIDAIKTADGIPGAVYYLTPSSFRETMHISSFHDISFLTALELAEKISIPIPSKIHIIAIEIIEDLEFSDEFSPLIAQKFDRIFQEVLETVQKLI